MDCKFILIADAVNLSIEGKLNIAGEFNTVFSDVTPIAYPMFYVVARMEAHAGEGLDHSMQAKITDDDGKMVAQMPPAPLKFGKGPPGIPSRADMVVGIPGLVLPKHGDYTVHVFIDGVQRADTVLYLRSTKDRPVRGVQG